MIRGHKLIHILLIFLTFSNIAFAQDKRGVGIFPLENFGNDQKFEWISFGISYLLSNKLSNISAYYVPEQRVIEKAIREAGYPGKKINGEMVYHVGKSSGINLGIVGNYNTNGRTIEVNIDFINAFNGASIFSKNYKKNYDQLFEIADDIATNLINLTTVTLTPGEQNIINRQITKSVKAFQNFCLGYLENEKPNGQREVVVGLFRNAIREDPNFWEASFNLGIAYFNDRDYTQALKQFDRIIAALPDFEKPYYGRAMIHFRNNDLVKAKNDFLQVIQFNPNDYKPYFYLGRISIQLEQYDDANKNLKKAAELNPDYSKIHIELGNIYFDQKKYRGGIQHYRRALDLDPEDIEALQKLGESYYRTQVYYSAYAQFKKILELEPTNPEANFMLGITAYKQAVLSELIEAFLELFEGDYPAKKEKKLAGTGRERSEVYREMVGAFNTAQKSRTNFLEATFNLALTYHDMGLLDSAQTYYLKTLQISPDLVKAHIKLAKVYDDQGKKELGLAQYKKVITIDPSYFIAHPTLGPEHDYINIMQVTLTELDEKLSNNPNNLEANQTMARIFFAQGYFGKAANIYRKILTISPNDNEAKKMLAKLDKP
ncbi:MAG: tetratricopeptide repeat protein [Calditrichales bacterium]|nr:MAG: tetratricopeptide repeat protein [Calditrichales bacterium]